MDRGHVVVDAAALRQHLTQMIVDENMVGGPLYDYHYETFLQFRPSVAPADADPLAAFAAGIEAANAASRVAGQLIQAFRPFPTPSGPTAELEFSHDDDAPERWAAALADHLAAAGYTGEVVPRHSGHVPEWLLLRLDAGGLTTHLVTPPRPARDGVPLGPPRWDTAPGELSPGDLEWLLRVEGELHLSLGQYTTTVNRDDPFLEDLFAHGSSHHASVCATVSGSTGTHYRCVAATAEGPTQYGAGNDQGPLERRLDDLREPLLAHADRADLGFVRQTIGLPLGWTGVNGAYRLPLVEQYEVAVNAGLLAQYVPDVHGIQLLTDAHLSHLSERTLRAAGWRVEAIGHGKHLVSAGDLDAWYGQALPDPDLLQDARRLFAPIILTSAVIAARR